MITLSKLNWISWRKVGKHSQLVSWLCIDMLAVCLDFPTLACTGAHTNRLSIHHIFHSGKFTTWARATTGCLKEHIVDRLFPTWLHPRFQCSTHVEQDQGFFQLYWCVVNLQKNVKHLHGCLIQYWLNSVAEKYATKQHKLDPKASHQDIHAKIRTWKNNVNFFKKIPNILMSVHGSQKSVCAACCWQIKFPLTIAPCSAS